MSRVLKTRSPDAHSRNSVVSEVGDPLLVEAEVVGELVENGDADLLAQLVGIGNDSSSGMR